MDKQNFDFEAFKEQAASCLKNGETLLGKDGVLALTKRVPGRGIRWRTGAYIEDDGDTNRKNGKGRKQVKTAIGSVAINPPRDKNGTFDPELIP